MPYLQSLFIVFLLVFTKAKTDTIGVHCRGEAFSLIQISDIP
jgi:hypothetical protein